MGEMGIENEIKKLVFGIINLFFIIGFVVKEFILFYFIFFTF